MSESKVILKCEKCRYELPDMYRYGRTYGSICPKCKEGKMYITEQNPYEKTTRVVRNIMKKDKKYFNLIKERSVVKKY